MTSTGAVAGPSGSANLKSFDPSQLSGVAHWYKADRGVTLNSTTVSQWNDQVGTAHVSQGTGANQPTFNATDAGYANQPTVQSTATSQFLVSGALTTNQAFTLWVIGQFATASAAAVALSASDNSGALLLRSGSKGTITAGSTLQDPVDITSKCAIMATFNGASSFVGVNDWLTGGTSGAAGAHNGSKIAMFAYTGGDFGSTGKIAELIVQAGTPTSQEKTDMAAYVSQQYVITVT